MDVSVVVFILPFTLWLDRNKVPAMLKFDDSGIAMQLKNGLIVEAGWNLVKSVKFHRWAKLTNIRLKGIVYPYTSQFPPEVTGALMAKLAGGRQSLSQPTAPTLEDQVDSRLDANVRM